MDEKEPAWEAALRRDIRDALAKSDGYEPDWLSPHHYQDETAAILRVFDSHIQAAEERGRREALTEAAGKIRKHPGLLYTRDAAADLIDPAKPGPS